MLCDICHKNIATVHLTEVVNDKVVEMHICQGCTKLKAEEIQEQFSISELLGGLVDIGQIKKEDTALKCSSCGLTYADFKKKGRFGCSNCYVTFKSKLSQLLKKIHGSTHHVGKSPLRKVTQAAGRVSVKELKERLERAIQLEEYEEAARLRDELRKLDNV
jgi:protein arginine kinase activator